MGVGALVLIGASLALTQLGGSGDPEERAREFLTAGPEACTDENLVSPDYVEQHFTDVADCQQSSSPYAESNFEILSSKTDLPAESTADASANVNARGQCVVIEMIDDGGSLLIDYLSRYEC